ncbi:MAG: glycosyl hydrolase family 18 protein [Candidatus Paceibacterota bacterium]
MKKLGILLVFILLPWQGAQAASLEVAGWIPWWQDTMGVESAEDNIRKLDIIYPFAFEVQPDGTLKDRADLDEKKWRDLFKQADKRRVDVLPTVMWFDGDQIHAVLSDKKKRQAHIEEIVDMVEEGDFDGVNIDYEGKLSDTIDYFSDFLEELEDELGRKDLSCTIEARTPPGMIYKEGEIPNPIRYANDYKAMNKYCDWVEIMAYDQQRAILTLNKNRQGEPYNPVADTEWVEEVIKLALEDIDEDKIMLGVPTYGRQWDLVVAPEWYKSYTRVSALNMPDAEELADDYDKEPGRNAAGELSYTYFHKDTIWGILDKYIDTPKGTRQGFEAAAKALLFANASGMEIPVRLVWYSDAGAIEEKVELAEKYDLKGIAIFKIDGEEDPDIWDLF